MKIRFVNYFPRVLIVSFLFVGLSYSTFGQLNKPRFRVVAIAEKNGGVHAPFVAEAKKWLDQLALENKFTIDYIDNTEPINDAFLANYQLFIQLNYPPYMWTDTAKEAFQKYIVEGKGGGWIGFHHASLLGEFDGYQMWPWFSEFMGGIRYKNYIATFAKATVQVEAKNHQCLKGVPATFEVEKEEWYTYNKSPRPNVKVLATVDEATYEPDSKIKMGGDHPVIWSNEHMKARNVYIFMGHHPGLFKNDAFVKIFRNAIFWGAEKGKQ
ncbi:ThuA domain-containing protein [Spirosoma sp. KCTC 42546]|uniref:ThuA domain-containing protein n=1 Tax=Spirosoma sp. KCTC 42546 TaxID=2520506 RepID=UPI0011580790|nr:ThuA domain-containing protein [Spirosoma sp. KCTC 42546]QDK82008.1 ThuA domain-containing protein [Spirosoma sp. KCTC 42546]